MKIHTRDYLVNPDKGFRLDKCPTKIKPLCKTEDEYRIRLEKHAQELSKLQQVLYASGTYALLVVFQAMDAAGKDGAIAHVMSGVNPQGCDVFSFKKPSLEELKHDFLWRTNRCLPARGKIGIFNRSHYEEVLSVRVHPELLAAQGLSPEVTKSKDIWDLRLRSIKQSEHHLHRNGTRIVKIFLNVSKEEQRKRLLDRIDDPEKNWKFNSSDLGERAFWDQYMDAYQCAIEATSTPYAPWFVVPADDKENARLIVSHVILEALEGMKLSYPKLSATEVRDLQSMREQLTQ